VRHDEPVEEAEVASYARARRAAISALHTGERLVIAAGDTKVRSNDDDYPYRAHSAFAHLTGWGSSTVPGSLLVFEPAADGHDVTLYFRKTAGHDTDEFYANSAIGEFWTGPRPTLEQVSVELGIATRDLTEFESRRGDLTETDPQLAQELSELRLVKDTWEVDELRRAVAATSNGFDDILAHLDRASAHPRGERVVEGAFHARARLEGNHVGYSTIAASGPHACYLHWSTNDGPVLPGDLILVDAGVEVDSYYTADITRTVPISGTFTPVQRRVYEAVLRAADEAFAIVRPGITFRTVHETALASIARSLDEWGGILPMSLEEALKPEHQPHRRYMVHGTSHHLGLDVHDCAQARREMRARARHGVHDRTGALLPPGRPHRARGTARHRRADRRRHRRHRHGRREPFGGHPPLGGRRRGLARQPPLLRKTPVQWSIFAVLRPQNSKDRPLN
jgi:Xaa-Pro aminopeptidase